LRPLRQSLSTLLKIALASTTPRSRGASEQYDRASPRRYAAMMAEDRDLRMKGYVVYRFGGAELTTAPVAHQLLETFLDRLAARHTTS
jgi:hypothetical protein